MPSHALDYVRELQGYLSAGLGPHRVYRQYQGTIDQLMRAIGQTRTVQIRYDSASRDCVSRRDVDPYRLLYNDLEPYLIGYCPVRKVVRMFAVERSRSLAISNRLCQVPLRFDLEAFVREAMVSIRGQPVEVELRFDRTAAASARGQTWHSSQQVTELEAGRLGVILKVSDTQELVEANFAFRCWRPCHPT